MTRHRRTISLSKKADEKVDRLVKETGLKYSTVIERLILGLSVGTSWHNS
jgi:hypothetical protein